MEESTICNFPHIAPIGYSYQFEQFNNKFISIWLLHSFQYSYTNKPVRSIWGFYSIKEQEYYAPINSSKVGEKVKIEDTRNYTAMKLKLTPLEAAFQ
jgi:hypothetical protein